jgi:hypothetical protein
MASIQSSLSHSRDWRGFYNAAIFEPDSTKLPDRIAQAEEVICQCARDLFQNPGDHADEEQALDDAIYVLHALRSASRPAGDWDNEDAV